jgi:D-aminopeptidase
MSTLSADDQRAFDALRAAVAEALERKRRLGQYAVIWRNGQAVRIEPEKDASSEHPSEPGSRG